jgi:AraC-like DNA-binding protein
MTAQSNVIVLSTDELENRDREAVVRDFYGRICMRLDLEPLERGHLRLNASTTVLPGMSVTRATVAPMAWERTAELMEDANDDLCVSWIEGGFRFDRPRHQTIETAPGAACIMPMDQAWRAQALNGEGTVCVQLSKTMLEPLVRHIGDLRPDAINRETPEGRLLLDYVSAVTRGPITPGLAPLISQHIADLLAASIGTSQEAEHVITGRGVRAARMRAIKQYIEENLHHSRLSTETAGRSLNLSPRYIRRLFAGGGRSFSDYVTERRLARIYRRLTDPRFACRSIADIAFEMGLVEPSTFYRQFKARYGMKPSEARTTFATPRR